MADSQQNGLANVSDCRGTVGGGIRVLSVGLPRLSVALGHPAVPTVLLLVLMVLPVVLGQPLPPRAVALCVEPRPKS